MSDPTQAGEASEVWFSVDLGKVPFEENLRPPDNALAVVAPPPPPLLRQPKREEARDRPSLEIAAAGAVQEQAALEVEVSGGSGGDAEEAAADKSVPVAGGPGAAADAAG